MGSLETASTFLDNAQQVFRRDNDLLAKLFLLTDFEGMC